MRIELDKLEKTGNQFAHAYEPEEIVLDEEHPRIDGWFLCIAPLDNPQLAMAVIVEGGGYGSKSAAPIAAALVLKARDLGLLGNPPQQQPPQQQQGPQRQQGTTNRPPAARPSPANRR